MLVGASGGWGPLAACAPAYIGYVAFSVFGPVYLEDGVGFSTKATGLLVGVRSGIGGLVHGKV